MIKNTIVFENDRAFYFNIYSEKFNYRSVTSYNDNEFKKCKVLE
jgi:hypothetical protein